LKNLLIAIAVTMGLMAPLAADAANVSIVGGSYGAACNSGGYFTPSAVSLNSGDTLKISVPADDPYPAGMEVHGFPEGNFNIARGGSHTTAALTKNVSFYATWPSSGCMKGSGTVTVKSAAPVASVAAMASPTASATASPSTSPSATPAPAMKHTSGLSGVYIGLLGLIVVVLAVVVVMVMRRRAAGPNMVPSEPPASNDPAPPSDDGSSNPPSV
jgi:hypothetical protein